MTGLVGGVFEKQRLQARLTSLFSVLALVVAVIGVHGVTAYSVGSRRNEIGVRMTLRAGRREVLVLILRKAMVLIGIGLAAGVPVALWAGWLLRSPLYGLEEQNPCMLIGAAVVLGLTGMAAALLPAMWSTRISPMEALRGE